MTNFKCTNTKQVVAQMQRVRIFMLRPNVDVYIFQGNTLDMTFTQYLSSDKEQYLR